MTLHQASGLQSALEDKGSFLSLDCPGMQAQSLNLSSAQNEKEASDVKLPSISAIVEQSHEELL